MVEAERKNIVEDFGRVLMREARGLGVADCVTGTAQASPSWAGAEIGRVYARN
jgi:hypothetical protein